MHSKTNGLVVAVDGPDGVGKTTQVSLLADHFRKMRRTVHVTRSSGGTPIGEEIRAVSLSDVARPPLTDFYLSLAMGAALAEDISHRRSRGEVIIIDRSPLAWIAYNAYGSQIENKEPVLRASLEGFADWQIDELFMLQTSQTQLDERRAKRGTKDYFEKQGQDYHARVRQGYNEGLTFLQKQKIDKPRVVLIDAGSTIEEIHQNIINSLMM